MRSNSERESAIGGTRRVISTLRHHRAARAAIGAFGAFSVAEQATWVALLVVAYGYGGVAETGLVAAAVLLPAALVAPVVAVRVGGGRIRRVLPVASLVQSAAFALTAALLAVDVGRLPVYLAAGVLTVVLTATRPAHQAWLAASSPDVSVRVDGAVASGFVDGCSKLVGPLEAAALIAVSDVAAVFAVGSLLAFVAAVVARDLDSAGGRSTPEGASRDREVRLRPPSFVATTRSIAGCRGVFSILATLGVGTVLLGVVETISTEISFDRLDGAAVGAGLLLGAFGTGLVIGGALVAPLLARVSGVDALFVGALLAAGGLVASACVGGRTASLVTFAVIGVGLQMVQVSGWVLLQQSVPTTSTAAVFGLLESHQLVGNALGAAVAGVAAAELGLGLLVAVASIAILVTTALVRTRLSVEAHGAGQVVVPSSVGGQVVDVSASAVINASV